MRRLYQLARADFLERVRRYSFLITLGIVVWAGYMFLPANPSDYTTLALGDYRGEYNSPYVGSLISMMGSIYLSLIGFYLVKNAIRRDRITGVGEIIAATPVSRFGYLTGKLFSNFAVLASMVFVLMVAAGVTQLIRGESTLLEPLKLAAPFVFICLPVALATSGVAVLFESVRFLRGGLGNVVYYFAWTGLLIGEIEGGWPIFGHSIFLPSIQRACAAVFPSYSLAEGRISSGIIVRDSGFDLTTFSWPGVDWTWEILATRLGIAAAGIVLVGIAAIVFDRFDRTATLGTKQRGAAEPAPEPDRSVPVAVARTTVASLGQLDARDRIRSRYLSLVSAELKLLLRRHGMWWWAVAVGLIVAGVFVPISVARQFIWPAAFIWPILVWSSLGWKEHRFRTDQIVFATPHPLVRQLSASWVAALLITGVVGAGMCLRLASAGDTNGVIAWVIGIAFVPTAALAFGVVTGSGKFFEILYLLFWYGGLMSGAEPLDFVGVIEGTAHSNQPVYYLIATGILFVVALIGRWRQVRG